LLFPFLLIPILLLVMRNQLVQIRLVPGRHIPWCAGVEQPA
jgi:hypothetical protein